MKVAARVAAFLIILAPYLGLAQNHEVETNNIYMKEAPAWLTRNRVDRVVAHIQTLLEWDIRKVTVSFHKDQGEFERFHGMGPSMLAVSYKLKNTIHLGPKVTAQNFDSVFGHELVHIISFQKYKGAIPLWLEEGLANYLAKSAQVNYKWLASKPYPQDVRQFTHPAAGTVDDIHYHYVTSQALVEMIARKCDLSNLLRLSVGTKMDGYLETYCEIKDLNADYRKWVKTHAAIQ